MPLLELKILEIHSFPQFSPTCFDILSWNFAYDFILQFECCQFLSILIGVMPLLGLKILEIQFSAVFSDMLWHTALKFCIRLCGTVLQIKFERHQFPSIFVGVMPLLELKILEIQFSAVFSYMLWHIELKFCIWLYFTVLQIKFECRQFLSILIGVMPLLGLKILEIQFSAVFSDMLWQIELKFCIWLCFIVLQIKLKCRRFASIFVGVMPLLKLRIPEIHFFPFFSDMLWQIEL